MALGKAVAVGSEVADCVVVVVPNESPVPVCVPPDNPNEGVEDGVPNDKPSPVVAGWDVDEGVPNDKPVAGVDVAGCPNDRPVEADVVGALKLRPVGAVEAVLVDMAKGVTVAVDALGLLPKPDAEKGGTTAVADVVG